MPTGYQQLRVPKMAELVAQQLRRQIVRGELTEGQALPPEAALMSQFAISRPTLREAFRVLESEGLISVRRGAHGGARVQTPNGDVAARYAGLVLEHRGTTLADVYDARNAIEASCAVLLAHRRTQADVKKLTASIEHARAAIEDPHAFIRHQHDFHGLLVDLAGNRTLSVLHGMVDHIIGRSTTTLDPGAGIAAGTAASVRAIQKGLRAHEQVVELILTRDAEATDALWRRHLVEAEDFVVGAQANPKNVIDLLG